MDVFAKNMFTVTRRVSVPSLHHFVIPITEEHLIVLLVLRIGLLFQHIVDIVYWFAYAKDHTFTPFSCGLSLTLRFNLSLRDCSILRMRIIITMNKMKKINPNGISTQDIKAIFLNLESLATEITMKYLVNSYETKTW